jgi:heme O synthase-like polyprenyltransferase
MFGYYMAPVPIILTPFVASSVVTALTIFSACSINQIMEINNDAKMLRTKTRWLPSQRISTPHAIGFSAVTGISGFMLLYHVVNPLAAVLATGSFFPSKKKKKKRLFG